MSCSWGPREGCGAGAAGRQQALGGGLMVFGEVEAVPATQATTCATEEVGTEEEV